MYTFGKLYIDERHDRNWKAWNTQQFQQCYPTNSDFVINFNQMNIILQW